MLKGEVARFPPACFHSPQLGVNTSLFSSFCRANDSCESGEGRQPQAAEGKQGKCVPAASSSWCGCRCCVSTSGGWQGDPFQLCRG